MRNSRYSCYRFAIETILFLTYALFGASWACCGSLLGDIMKELHLDLSQAGFLSTAVSFAKIFGPALAGFLSVRLGLRWAVAVASGLICLGLAAPFSPDFAHLLLARFGMGLGGAMVVVYFTPMVISWFPPQERAAVNGLNFVAINTGMCASLAFSPALLQWVGNWRNALLTYSLLSLLLFISWVLMGRESDGNRVDADPANTGGRFLKVAGHVLRDANLWKLVFAYSGVLSFYLVLFTYFPTYYREVLRGELAPLAKIAPALAMGTGIPAALLGILLTKRTGLRLPFLRISGFLLLCAIPGLYLVSNPALILASSLVVGFSLFLWASPFFTIPTELPEMTAERSSAFMGLFWATSYSIATILVWLTGKIASAGDGFLPAFLLINVAAGTLLAGSFLLPETGPKSKKTRRAELLKVEKVQAIPHPVQ